MIVKPQSGFINVIASEVINSQRNEIEIVADEAMNPTEEATQHAQAYWLLGYSWEEIEAILEDLGFQEKVISSAIAKTVLYARDMLNDGPFRTLKEGQLIKLTSGFIGQIAAIYPEHVNVADLDTEEIIRVSEDQIDKADSAKLKEAFALRYGAYKLIKAQGGPTDITIPGQKEWELPAPPQQMGIAPSPTEKLDVKLTDRAPPGWGELTPPLSDIEEVSDVTATILSQVDAAEDEMARVNADLKELNLMAKELRSKQKELSKRESELAKQVFSVVGTEQQALNDLDVTFFQKYKNKILGLQRKIQEIPQEPGIVDELRALKEILDANAPEISTQVLDTLEKWKKVNTTIEERIRETFALYPPPRKKSAQFMERIVEFMESLWEIVKTTSANLYYTVFPKIETVSDAIDAFVNSTDHVTASQKLRAALNQKGLF